MVKMGKLINVDRSMFKDIPMEVMENDDGDMVLSFKRLIDVNFLLFYSTAVLQNILVFEHVFHSRSSTSLKDLEDDGGYIPQS